MAWSLTRKNQWTHSSGAFIARFTGLGFLLFESRADYEAIAGDFKTFDTLKDAKSYESRKK